MNKITFIVGGARSGKSTHALGLAKKYRDVAFVATCQGLDKEMRERICLHQRARPAHWKTFEETKEIAPLVMKIGSAFDCIIIDCLTLLVSNLMLNGLSGEEILQKVREFLAQVRKKKARVIIVSNEVGLGIVPATKLGRGFRDVAGKVNQAVARVADEVIFMVSGLPLKIK